MVITDRKLPYQDDPFTSEGYWWPAFAAKKGEDGIERLKLHGKLTYSPKKGCLLKLFHGTQGMPWGTNMIHGGEGFGQYDEKFSCYGLTAIDHRSDHTVYKVAYVFRGFLLPNKEGNNIKRISFSAKNLNRWKRSSGFSYDIGHQFKKFKIKYKERKGRWYKLNSKLSYRISQSAYCPLEVGDHGEVRMKETVQVEINALNNKAYGIDYFLRIIDPFVDFFTIASGDLCSPYAIYLHGNFSHIERLGGKRMPSYAQLFMSENKFSDFEYEVLDGYYLFREDDLENNLQNHLKNWLSKYHLLYTPLSLFKSAVYFEKYAETGFLLLCQSVESYHRNCIGGQYMDANVFMDEVYSPLKKSIPGNIHRDFRAALKNRLKFANEYSLRKRIQDLIRQHNSVFEKHLKTTGSLSKSIADARNYLTHYPDGEEPFNIDLLGFFSTILKTIFTLSMMREMGFSQNNIEDIALKCERMNSIRYSAPWDLRTE